MKRTLALLCIALAAFSTEAIAQKNTDPVYYTDSDVEHNYVSFGIHYDPLYSGRRLFALNNADANAGLDREDFPATGGYGYNWGGYMDFNINSSLRLGVGAGRTTMAYRLDDYPYIDGNGDTSNVGLNVGGLYNSFPLRIGFATPMNDAWDLEIWIPIAYNRLSTYTESTSLNGSMIENDLTDQARKEVWSVAILVGGAFYFTDNWAITAHAQFRYFTAPMIDKPDRPTETPYGAGVSLGIRYRP